jgi:hypothetical protein
MMAHAMEMESVLDAAFAGVSRVAEFIVSLPEEDRQQALAAAEQSYFKTARELGYSEGQALGWASSLLTKLRSEIDRYAQGIVDAA